MVYELFHVGAKCGREVIDRVRVDEANRLKGDLPQRKVVKRARWPLLRNSDKIPADQQPKLDELLAANETLMTVYVMKASFKEFGLPAVPALVCRLADMDENGGRQRHRAVDEVRQKNSKRTGAEWCRVHWPMHTGQLEGINNGIKVMKRMPYGYRDSAFSFLNKSGLSR